jgi:hypothetical protein
MKKYEWIGLSYYLNITVFRKLWIRLLKVYDDVSGIRWKRQSLDSVSVKALLGVHVGLVQILLTEVRQERNVMY